MTKFIIKTILFIVSIVITIVLIVDISKTKKNKYTQAFDEFYVNDHLGVLLTSTNYFITKNGNFLYEESNDSSYDSNLRGAQIVVLTYDVKDNINTTNIFNSLGVGKNDLGIMIFMGFEKNMGEYQLTNLTIEIGDQMKTFISAAEASLIKSEHFDNFSYDFDFDGKIFNLYYHLLERVLNKLYGFNNNDVYNSFYNLDDYLDYKYETYPRSSLSNTLTLKQIVYIIIIIISFLGSAGFNLILFILFSFNVTKNKGGGGKSSGYKF